MLLLVARGKKALCRASQVIWSRGDMLLLVLTGMLIGLPCALTASLLIALWACFVRRNHSRFCRRCLVGSGRACRVLSSGNARGPNSLALRYA